MRLRVPRAGMTARLRWSSPRCVSESWDLPWYPRACRPQYALRTPATRSAARTKPAGAAYNRRARSSSSEAPFPFLGHRAPPPGRERLRPPETNERHSMAKEEHIEMEGVVSEVLPDTRF